MVEIGDFEFYGDEGAEDRMRELIEQRDELLEALQMARRELEMWAEADGLDPYNNPRINAAISRALGANKE